MADGHDIYLVAKWEQLRAAIGDGDVNTAAKLIGDVRQAGHLHEADTMNHELALSSPRVDTAR